MADTVTRVEKKVGRALATFQKAHDGLAAVEAEATAEVADIGAQIDATRAAADARCAALTERADVVTRAAAQAAGVRRNLAQFVITN